MFFRNYLLLSTRFNALVIIKIEHSFFDQLPNICSGLKIIWSLWLSTVITHWCLEYIKIVGLNLFVISRVWPWDAPTWRATEAVSFAPLTKFSCFGFTIAFKKLSVKFPTFSMELIKGYDLRNIEVSRNLLLCC